MSKGIYNRSLSKPRQPHSEETKRKLSESAKERIIPQQMRDKISATLKLNPVSYWKGKRRPPFSDEFKKKQSIRFKGKNNPFWKGGISSIHRMIINLLEHRQWRESIFKRDDYTCQICNQKGGRLNAHHKTIRFSAILHDFLKEYSQFSPIEDKEILIRLAITYKLFWDISNGETLCKKCHNKKHKKETICQSVG